MVFRKAYDTVNKVGRAWTNLNQGNYNSPAQAAQASDGARDLLTQVVADWPTGQPDTPAVTAARAYLRRAER